MVTLKNLLICFDQILKIQAIQIQAFRVIFKCGMGPIPWATSYSNHKIKILKIPHSWSILKVYRDSVLDLLYNGSLSHSW